MISSIMNCNAAGRTSSMLFWTTKFACGDLTASLMWFLNSETTTSRSASVCALARARWTRRQPCWSCESAQTLPATTTSLRAKLSSNALGGLPNQPFSTTFCGRKGAQEISCKLPTPPPQRSKSKRTGKGTRRRIPSRGSGLSAAALRGDPESESAPKSDPAARFASPVAPLGDRDRSAAESASDAPDDGDGHAPHAGRLTVAPAAGNAAAAIDDRRCGEVGAGAM
mmetsp:Transcript_16670/g.48381  ORF Transcript_16670/g.48381 Transcript_16670/m.48381 type:complete len:226 (-) Transcript_16670:66-743(-)